METHAGSGIQRFVGRIAGQLLYSFSSVKVCGMALTAAHKGYEYQDICSAYLILKAFREFKDFKFFVDQKEHEADSFDDLTIITGTSRLKFQIRHSTEQLITVKDLHSNGKLSLKNFSQSYSKSIVSTQYVLATTRNVDLRDNSFIQVRSNNNLLSKNVWRLRPAVFSDTKAGFVKQFVIDAGLPRISRDFKNPGEMEQQIFDFLKKEIGVGGYPNDDLQPEAFADALCRLIRSIRAGSVAQPVSKTVLINLFQTAGLKVDYGHIAQQFPLISSEQRLHFPDLQKNLIDACLNAQTVILVGLPGSGKSHQFDSLCTSLNKRTDVVATHHYCYLEPTDDLVIERINVNRMFGNLVYQLSNKFQDLAQKLPRLYAADRIKIEEFAKAIVEKENKRVIVMVDGLDHLERVVNQKGGLSKAIVNRFIEELSRLRLPKNSTLLISSQPGAHLQKFRDRKDVRIVEMPPWSEVNVDTYLKKEGFSEEFTAASKEGKTLLSHLTDISEGNPLYLNYLVKEMKVRKQTDKEVWSIVKSLPQLHSNINQYYDHLIHTVRAEDMAVAETIALLDFSVNSEQLTEMFPKIDSRRVMTVIKQLSPVLRESFAIGGFRIYHESFRRYVLENASKRRISKKELYRHIIDWLTRQRFFDSVVSYHYLFPYLRRGQQANRIAGYISADFLTESIYNLHSVEAISANIALAADVASEKCDWGTLAQLVQINKALYTFSDERDYIHGDLADTYLKVFGPKAFAKKLTLNGKPVFSLTTGFKYCHSIAKAGGDAPWGSYELSDFSMTVDNEEKKRLFHELEAGFFYQRIFGNDLNHVFELLINRLKRHKKVSNQNRCDLLIDQIFLQHKAVPIFETFIQTGGRLHSNKEIILALSRFIREEAHIKKFSKLLSAIKRPFSALELRRLAKVRIDIRPLVDVVGLIQQLNKSAKVVIEAQSIYEDDLENFKTWYYLLPLVAAIKTDALKLIKNEIRPDGWYRAWLIFLIDLALAERIPTPKEREKVILVALERLSQFREPFEGKPRACDLYTVHFLTYDSFLRAIATIESAESMEKASSILDSISSGTTTTLQRSASGPLTEEALSELYAENLSEKKKEVKDVLKQGVLKQFKTVKDRGRFYEEQATEGFKCARVLMQLGEVSNARRVFKEACRYAYGYGMRKDITAWEVIEPISSLYVKDRNFGIRAFEKTYFLPYIVAIHTDGAETRWTLSKWYETLFDADLPLGIRFLTQDIKLTHTERDWRVEFASEDIANRLVGRVNPKLLFDLYHSLEMGDFDRTDFKPRFALLEEFYRKRLPVEDYAYHLCLCLSIWSYHSTDKTPYIDTLKRFFSLHKKYKFKINEYFYKDLKQKISAASSVGDPLGLKKKLKESRKKKERIFNGLTDPDRARLALEDSVSEELNDQDNIKDFSALVSRLAKETNHSEASSLLVSYARKTYVSGPLRAMETMGDLLLKKGHKDLAAEAYAIGFFYSRGNYGWGVMGDKDSYPLARKSISISKSTFPKVLARETAQSIDKPVYFTRGNQHLVEVFCNVTGDISSARKIWNESYAIINHRLPSMKISGLKMPTILSKKKKRLSLEESVTDLINQRKKIIHRY